MLKRQNVSFAIKEEKETAFGVTFPLLTSESGEKFGKSAGNAIWLDEAQTNVHHFYQVSRLLYGLQCPRLTVPVFRQNARFCSRTSFENVHPSVPRRDW